MAGQSEPAVCPGAERANWTTGQGEGAIEEVELWESMQRATTKMGKGEAESRFLQLSMFVKVLVICFKPQDASYS